jgi:succinyl-diaminopimelate desuccinylase
VFDVSTGFNDMHFFSHYRKIPTLGYGPGGEREHAMDERAKVRDLVATAKIYAELLTAKSACFGPVKSGVLLPAP